MSVDATEANWIDREVLSIDSDTPALACHSELTYLQAKHHVQQWTDTLVEHGVGAESTVAIQLAPSFTFIFLVLASWRLGAQLNLIDFRLSPAELAQLLHQRQPQLLIRGAESKLKPQSFTENLDVTLEHRSEGRTRSSAHCLVQFTSGSTGQPKTVGRTAQSLIEELVRFDRIPGSTRQGDRVLLLNSISHTFGLLGGVLHTLRSGAGLVFADRPLGRTIVTQLYEAQANVVFGVPFHFEMMAATPAGTTENPLRIAVSGGELMPARIRDAFQARFGVPVGEAYGMTEVGIIAADYLGDYPGTVGPLTSSVRGRVAHGQLQVWIGATPYLSDGLGNTFSDGWLSTHDTAVVDERAVVTIGARTDSLVVIGGLKVDLGEVEAVLSTHPAVSAAVVVMGTNIEAYVETTEPIDLADLAAWCSTRLAAVKIPKAATALPALPRTPTGKLTRDRQALLAASVRATS